MKPDKSLEKAARRAAYRARWLAGACDNGDFGHETHKQQNGACPDITKLVVSLLQRHGAKVRRETLKEAAEVVSRQTCKSNCDCCDSERLAIENILALTPRGPEKGRRAK